MELKAANAAVFGASPTQNASFQGSKFTLANVQFATGLRTFAPEKELRSKFAPPALNPFS